MPSVLIHDTLYDEILLSDLSDGGFRALHGSMFYVAKHHTDWRVPMRDVHTVSPTYTHAVYQELCDKGWWIDYDGHVLIATHGPRDRDQVLMRRCADDRAPISLAVRGFVYERDGFSCVECRATDNLSIDHIWPWSRGGSDDVENLRTLCRPCNSRKGARV